jgi:hypothetical protein
LRTSDHGRERNNCLNHHLQFKAVIGEKRERKSAGSQSARFSGFVACVKALQQSCVTGGDELIRNLCSFWSSLFREPFLFFLRAFLFLRAKAISICTFAIKNGRTCLEGGGPMHHETKTPGGVRCSRQSCHERGSSLSSANWQHIWATKTTPTYKVWAQQLKTKDGFKQGLHLHCIADGANLLNRPCNRREGRVAPENLTSMWHSANPLVHCEKKAGNAPNSIVE